MLRGGGVELGVFDSGEVPVLLSIEFDDIRFADAPLMGGNGKSLEY